MSMASKVVLFGAIGVAASLSGAAVAHGRNSYCYQTGPGHYTLYYAN